MKLLLAPSPSTSERGLFSPDPEALFSPIRPSGETRVTLMNPGPIVKRQNAITNVAR